MQTLNNEMLNKIILQTKSRQSLKSNNQNWMGIQICLTGLL